MSEIEAALDRIDKFIDNDSDDMPDPETQLSVLTFAAYYIMKTDFSKVVDTFGIDGEDLYRSLNEAIRKHIKKDSNGNYIPFIKGEE